jgi:hypothetical protein
MNKYKYRLVELEDSGEENNSKKPKFQTELFLKALGKYTADKLLTIINTPSNLKGTYVKYDSEKLTNLEKKVFGPGGKSSNEAKKKMFNGEGEESGELYGLKLLQDIIKNVGKFSGTPDFKNDENNNIEFFFPEKNTYNIDLVRNYFNKVNPQEKSIKSNLTPTKIDDMTIQFPPREEKFIEQILTNAGLSYKKDYTLEKIKSKLS